VGRLVSWPGGPPRQILQEKVEQRRGPLLEREGSPLDKLFARAPDFLVTPLFMGSVRRISQGRLEEPVPPLVYVLIVFNSCRLFN